MDRAKFEEIIRLSKDRRYHIQAIAVEVGVSERQVNRVKEAGTWERWPYIQAKIKCGYNTPEYKAYLKRRGLPLTPPPKITVHKGRTSGSWVPKREEVQPSKSWWRRLFGF